MKGLLVFIGLLFLSIGCYAQKEASVWYFGQYAGLKFNDDGSTTPLTDGKLNTSEGCSSIADVDGNLLFYTDGVSVWNKAHQIMQNGTGLYGTYTTTQTLIVPNPKFNNIYYIFTCAMQGGSDGFRYTEVDLSFNNGLGKITSNENILLATPVCEKVCAVKNAKEDGYWVMAHGFGNNSFLAYSVTAAGVNKQAVISNIGKVVSVDQSGANAIGYMKFSPSGKKIISCNTHLNNAELYDFDNSSGLVTNSKVVNENFKIYGVEFSPSEKIAYAIAGENAERLFQYDLTSSTIPNSKVTIYYNPNNQLSFGALQMGINGKIYGSTFESDNPLTINKPNILGAGCDFKLSGVAISPGKCLRGLPQFVQSVFGPIPEIDFKNNCVGDISFSLNTYQTISGAIWDFGDGSPTSNAINPTHQYAKVGNYKVTVTTTSSTGKIVSQSKTITISDVPIANIVSNQSVCGTDSMTYDLTQYNSVLLGSQSNAAYGVAYFLSSTDANNQQNVLPKNYNLPLGITTFYAKVYSLAAPNCFAITSFTVNSFSIPVANTPDAVFVCDDANNDAKATFDLQSESATVLGTQDPNQYTVSYYFSQNDANANSNPLALNYQNSSNPQTIYVRVTNNKNMNCFTTTSFQIGVNKMPIAHQPQNLYLCDDESNDGKELFDFTTQTPIVLGNQSQTDFNISYHLSQANADSNSEPITDFNAFPNTINPQTIYVRMENKSAPSCFATGNFQLIVMPSPVLEMNDTYSICEGKNIKISAPSGYTSYKWSNGATGNTVMITNAGNYSLTVTKDYGTIVCDVTKNITVYNSNVATITKIDTQDWSDNHNTISIQATGDGDYEYSVDGVHYQDSPIFNDLNSGSYTVYVNDKKGCGLTTDEVFLLMYPRYFTPNGDGYNDAWKIKFSITEPEMTLFIFDRFGKLITELSNINVSWDGTSNGHPMPSDDYWFVVKRQNGKEYKGHFSMVR